MGFLGLISDLSHFPGVPILSKQTINLGVACEKVFSEIDFWKRKQRLSQNRVLSGFFGIGFKNLENRSICVRVKVSIKGPPKTIIYSGKGFNSNSNSKFEKSPLKACNGYI